MKEFCTIDLVQGYLIRGEKPPIGIDIPILDPEKNPTDADLEALLPHPSLFEALNEATSGVQSRVVLGPEPTGVIGAGEAGLEPGGDDDDDEVEMVTEVVEEEPGQVDLEDSSGSEAESLDTLADSSDTIS